MIYDVLLTSKTDLSARSSRRAREDASACIKLNSSFAKGHFRLALALQAEDKPAEACAAFGKVLELEPAYTDASLALASILHAQGKTQAALDLLDEIATSQPELASWCEQQARAFKGGG